MDGMEVARRIRQLPQHSGFILIGVPGYGHTHGGHTAIEAGFDHDLVKPADLRELQEFIPLTICPLTMGAAHSTVSHVILPHIQSTAMNAQRHDSSHGV
jgi:CheY-like chemotaxis protein